MSDAGQIVITAASACCSLGMGRDRILDAMLAGGVEIDHAPGLEHRDDESPRAAQLPGDVIPSEDRPDRAERMIRVLVDAAAKEAGLDPAHAADVEVLFGTTLGGMRYVGRGLRSDLLDDYRLSTTGALNSEALAGTGLRPGGSSTSAACASGLSTLVLGATALLLGDTDMVMAVSYDPISEFAYAGFKSLRLVAEGPIRPFTEEREGMRLGEGGAAFVLERAESARARGAKPIGVLAGWGLASDAHHLTQPDPSGNGAGSAIRSALRIEDTLVPPDVVFAHATSTPANDGAEHAALEQAIGESFSQTPVTALKSRIGHTLGGAGAVECAVALAALERGVIPAAANASVDRSAFPNLDLVVDGPRDRSMERGLVVSLGFGGADAAVCVARPDSNPIGTRIRSGEGASIAITGVGIMVPEQTDGLHVDDDRLAAVEPARPVRRLARLARLVRVAGILASRDAELDAALLASTSGFVASRYGAVAYTLDCYEEIVRDGLDAGNPLYFAESVPNIGSAQLSLGLGLTEATLSVGGTRTAGLEAMHLACRHLRSGQSDRALVVAAEETEPRLRRILQGVGVIAVEDQATRIPEGGVGFLLERADSARSRGARVHGWIRETCVEWPTSRSIVQFARGLQACAKTVSVDGERPRTAPTSAVIGRFERRILGLEPLSEDVVTERHAVGPLLEIANGLLHPAGQGPWSVVASDESGGSGGISINRAVPSSS